MKITVVGAGYVGLSLATLLSVKNNVYIFDILPEKVEMINNRISPINDEYIEKYFNEKNLNLTATLDYESAFSEADFIIICTPTNYNEIEGYFDTSSVEDIILKVINMHLDTTIVIKSTIPVGFVNSIKKKYNISNIIFSPEFLREGKALYDNLYPSRIIVGDKTKEAIRFGDLLRKACLKPDVVVKYMDSTEAEAVKLFANTYLALRVSFFNELDTYAEVKGLNAKDIIEGVCLDPRIGEHYNNPSFGYGGYCLPKDTKQLLSNYRNIPQNLIEAIVKSNDTRKNHIADMVLSKNPGVVGIYRLIMKSNSDNFRDSSVLDLINRFISGGIKVIIYEPMMDSFEFMGCEIVNDLVKFNDMCDVIVANRYDSCFKFFTKDIYTRDIYNRD